MKIEEIDYENYALEVEWRSAWNLTNSQIVEDPNVRLYQIRIVS